MKIKRIWIIILIIITIVILLLFNNVNIKSKKNLKKLNNTLDNVNYWIYYKDESYDDNGEIYDENKEDDLFIKVEKKIITVCTMDPNRCETSQYEKKGDEYELADGSILSTLHLNFQDSYDEEYGKIIKMIKYHTNDLERNYTIFYFKKA